MRRLIWCLFVLSVGGCSNEAAVAAERITIPGSRFSVLMPGVATCDLSTIPAVGGNVRRHSCSYFDQVAARGYILEYVELASAPTEKESTAMLKAAVTGAAAMTESEVQQERRFSASGYPAIEATMVTPKNGFVAVVHYILVGSQLVTVSVEGGREAMQSSEVRAYLESFRISSATN